MSTSFRSFTFSRVAGALAALWLCGAGAAWAGDGADLASLNALLSTPNTGLCAILGLAPCPQLPTVTQGILEVAALTNAPPEIVAAQNSITPGSNVTAGNPAAVPPPDHGGVPFPLNSTTLPKLFGVTTIGQPGEPPVPGMLDTLTPIAFASQRSGTAVATQLYASNADTFLYAVGVSSQGAVGVGGLTNPDTVYFLYDDLFRVAQTFTKGQIVAKFSFPLTVLNNDGKENPAVMVTLEITSCANGLASCFNANAVGGIGTPQNPIPASQLGIQFALVFSTSPTSTQKHAIFEVAVPLLVTGACVGNPLLCVTGQPQANTDPPYFFSATSMMPAGQPGNVSAAAYLAGPRNGTFPLNGNFSIYTAFGDPQDDLGAIPTMSGILPGTAYSIGLAPTATPFCTAMTCQSGNPPPPPGSVPFALCASLPDNSNGPSAHLRPAVGAYYAIATDGEMFLSAPVPSVFSACSAL